MHKELHAVVMHLLTMLIDAEEDESSELGEYPDSVFVSLVLHVSPLSVLLPLSQEVALRTCSLGQAHG